MGATAAGEWRDLLHAELGELPGGLTRDLKGKVLEVLLCNISE